MIRLEKVSKSFGERVLFSDISMTFEAGKVYALIGASGSGKTTLMNIMAKLESYQGKVFFQDKELSEYKSTNFYRKELGYLFQNFGLIENQSVDENLKLGLVGKKLTKEERIRKEKEALERVGLSYIKLSTPIFELSGGESQRVAIAKVILKDPPIILADEPTASVDPNTSRLIMDMLLSLRNNNRVIIVATHSPEIWGMVDEVISVDDLKINKK